MKIFRADYVFPVSAEPIKNGIVAVDDNGKVISVSNNYSPDIDASQIEHVKGAICPGFINTHCHLELSHLKDKMASRINL